MITWMRGWLAAPRRLRELEERYGVVWQARVAERLVAKGALAAAEARAEHFRRRLNFHQDQSKRLKDLEDRIEVLRAENGENYRKYVRTQLALETIRNQHCRNHYQG